MQAAGVVTRSQALSNAQRNTGGGGGGNGGDGAEQPSPLFYLFGMLLMVSLGTLAYGIWGTDTKTPWIVASGVSFGLLLLLLAYVFRDSIFRLFDDPSPKGVQTGPSGTAASAADAPSLPLVVVSL